MTISSIEFIVYNILNIIISSGIIAFIIKNFIKAKIEQSIKHTYDKQLEEFKQEQILKNKVEVLAELLAEWLSFPEDRKKLNQLTFEAFLFLPDDICKELSRTLSHEKGCLNIRDLILKARQYLLKESNLKSYKVIVFPKIEKQCQTK